MSWFGNLSGNLTKNLAQLAADAFQETEEEAAAYAHEQRLAEEEEEREREREAAARAAAEQEEIEVLWPVRIVLPLCCCALCLSHSG